MTRGRCNFYFSFWAFSCPFTPPPPPPNSPRNKKVYKNEKKHLEITLFCTFVPKIMITCGTVPEMWCATDGRTKKVRYRCGCPT